MIRSPPPVRPSGPVRTVAPGTDRIRRIPAPSLRQARRKRRFSAEVHPLAMNACAEPLRLLYARWCLLAAAEAPLGAAGAPLPFRISVDGPRSTAAGEGGWVARYHASSTAGATLAGFPAHRAVLSCADAGWRVAGAPSADELLAGGPDWADHATMLDHRVRTGHFGWATFWEDGRWHCRTPPEPGLPLPPVSTTFDAAAALAARFEEPAAVGDTMFHLVRMCEYEWLDTASWAAAFGPLAPQRLIDESWERLVRFGLTQWTGSGPRIEGVPGRTAEQAVALAAEHAQREGPGIPEDVRVDSALRDPSGWRVSFRDYRDGPSVRPVVVQVPDEGPVRSLGRTPG
ncbi:hypothetical protein GCM10009581_31530 [Tsukamurella strandjordii]